MIDENIGIRMCKHKRIRKEYGTIIYNPTNVILTDPKIHYDEIHELMKKEKKKQKKQKKVTKKIDIKQMTKEKQIEQLVDISEIKSLDETEKVDDIFQFMEEPIYRENRDESVDVPGADVPDADVPDADVPDADVPDADVPDEPIDESSKEQNGGLMKKKIYVTDLSIEKDKEMFQM